MFPVERLETKTVNGHVYYYYSKWARVDGKPRRVWQKYLGKLEDIVNAVDGTGPAPVCADVFEWGLCEALWQECQRVQVVSAVNAQLPTRSNSLTTGDYLAIAALNRAISPRSKRSLWLWFAQTVLLRHFPHASQSRLTSQRFWNHMDRIQETDILPIWRGILKRLLQLDSLDLSSICYDSTNYYTFVDTFNAHCDLARRGKNKQGRSDLRQVNYALFCSADGQIPLYFEVYQGNCNDAKQFPLVLERFHQFLQDVTGQTIVAKTTVVFDKGNNSADNFALLDRLGLFFVGSMKLSEHKDLLKVGKNDRRFQTCASDRLAGSKSFRVRKEAYGQQRTVVVVYNQNLYNAQWQTLQNDIAKANAKLAGLQQRLEEQIRGERVKGKRPTVESVKRQSQGMLGRQHLKKVIKIEVTPVNEGLPRLQYGVEATELQKLGDTYLGKSLVVTNRDDWTDDQIVEAYRSQFLIEDVFKSSKDRCTGSWWPMHHWTDSKIRVHGLYCAIAQLLRAMLLRRVRQEGIKISLKSLMAELGGIREIINIYPQERKKRRKREPEQTVLSRRSELQNRLISILGLEISPTA